MKCPYCLAALPRAVILGPGQKSLRCLDCKVVLEVEDMSARRAIVLRIPANLRVPSER